MNGGIYGNRDQQPDNDGGCLLVVFGVIVAVVGVVLVLLFTHTWQ